MYICREGERERETVCACEVELWSLPTSSKARYAAVHQSMMCYVCVYIMCMCICM